MSKQGLLEAVRRAVADYIRSEGCSCCRDYEAHEEAKTRLGNLLDVTPYSDGSGHNFSQHATPRKKVRR